MNREQQHQITSNIQSCATFLAKAQITAHAAIHSSKEGLEAIRNEFAEHLTCATAHFEAGIERRMSEEESK